MASVESIIEDRNKIYGRAISSITSEFGYIERQIYNQLVKELKKLNYKSGSIQNDKQAQAFLLKIDNLIKEAFFKSDYTSKINKYLTDFDRVDKNIETLQGTVNDVKPDWRKLNDVKKITIAQTTDKLVGEGVNANFVQPLREMLYKNVVFGTSIVDIESMLKERILSSKTTDSTLLRYTNQVANDSIRQYAGTIEQKIGDFIGWNAIRYIGANYTCECGTCKGHCTRWQCKRWTKQGTILKENLQAEINLAFERGSGMIIGTTVDNFTINRGGWNCRHEAIPIKKL